MCFCWRSYQRDGDSRMPLLKAAIKQNIMLKNLDKCFGKDEYFEKRYFKASPHTTLISLSFNVCFAEATRWSHFDGSHFDVICLPRKSSIQNYLIISSTTQNGKRTCLLMASLNSRYIHEPQTLWLPVLKLQMMV